MRNACFQVGDRLIPVGYTSSRTPQGEGSGPITTEMTQEAFEQFMAGGGFAAAAGRNRSGSTARRSRRTEGADVSDLEEVSFCRKGKARAFELM